MSSTFFNDVEAAKIALSIERNGQKFYNGAARKARDPNVKRIFKQLASDEKEHIELFESLHQQLLDRPRRQGYVDSDEVNAYVQRLVDTQVFADEGTVARLVDQIDSDIGALGVGIRAERDALLFYQEMINFTDSKAAREAFGKIIEEERRHLVELGRRSDDCEKLHG